MNDQQIAELQEKMRAAHSAEAHSVAFRAALDIMTEANKGEAVAYKFVAEAEKVFFASLPFVHLEIKGEA